MEARRARQCPPEPSQYPWLVFSHGKNHKNQTFCDVGELGKTNSWAMKRSIPELQDRKVLACCHGWLVLSKETEYLLWNPVTLEVIQLPPLTLKHKQRVSHCILSSPPLDDDSIVILLDKRSSFAVFCSPGDENWTWQWLADSLRCPASCNGKLYALMGYKTLVEMKQTEDKQLLITPLDTEMPDINVNCFCQYLVECCGELFHIFFQCGGMKNKDVIHVEILRLDFSRMVWTKVRTAKDRVFFVNQELAFSCAAMEPAADQIRGNSVYFTRENDKSLYRYDLEDGCVSVSLPCPDLPTPWYSPIWIMPELKQRPSNQRGHDRVDKSREEILGLRLIQIKEANRIEESEENAGGKLSTLPLDVLDVIARCLKPFDYMSFRAVNRTCRSIAPPLQSRSSSMEFENLSLFPWLMRRETNEGVCSFIDPMRGSTYQVSIPVGCKPNSQMCCSRDGWCIMMDWDETSIFFWNPFAKKVVSMPNLCTKYAFKGFGFSSSPTASDCVVVAIDNVHELDIDFIRLGLDQEWHSVWCNVHDFIPSYNNNIVFSKGSFYFMSVDGSLGVMRMHPNHGFRLDVLQKPQRPCISFHQNFLLECKGELLSVFVGFLGKWVRVFKLIDVPETELAWVEVRNLGNSMLFVSDLSSFSIVAKTPSMANKVYFPRFYDQGIVFYSLESGKFQTFESEESLDNFYNTKEQLLFSWIEPKWF